MSHDRPQLVCDLAHRIFGVAPAEVSKISLGVMTYKFAVNLPNGEWYVFRFYPPSRESVVEYEPDLLRLCHPASVGAPEVVVDSRTGPRAEMNYVVYRMIQGTPLVSRLSSLSAEALGNVARDVVQRLGALSQIPVSGHGDLVTADRARFDSFGEFSARSFAEGLRIAEQNRLWHRETIEVLRAIADNATRMPETPVVLAWGDLSAENILLDSNNEIAGLVDFEGVIAANRLLNLGYAYARYYGSAFFDALEQAWKEPLQEREWHWIHFYCVLRAVRLVQFASEPLPTGHSRTPIEDLLPGFQPATNELAKRLGLKT